MPSYPLQLLTFGYIPVLTAAAFPAGLITHSRVWLTHGAPHQNHQLSRELSVSSEIAMVWFVMTSTLHGLCARISSLCAHRYKCGVPPLMQRYVISFLNQWVDEFVESGESCF